MKILLSVLCLCLSAGVALAGYPPAAEPSQPVRTACDMPSVAYDWNFANGNQGFTTGTCDSGGSAVWQFGTSNIPGAPGTVWGTILQGNYPDNSGDGLISPQFMVGNGSYLLEIMHYFDIETNYDGGNVKVNGTVVIPDGGYTGTISTSTSYYAWCVDMELGWTGHENQWRTDCFDLSAYMGQMVTVELDFGSDSSVNYPGWYIAYLKVGGQGGVPTAPTSWGQVKSLYR